MGIPKKALRRDQLEDLTAGPAIKDGSHQVIQAKVIIDGVTRIGYFKPLDPKNHYPELLARLSVAFSICKRLSQGKRSAAEYLVYDNDDKIVGSFSVAVANNLKKFNSANDEVPTDPSERERVIPSTKTLLETNAIETIFSRWIFDDNDFHAKQWGIAPANPGSASYKQYPSVTVDYDFDMLGYWLTIFMKKPRLLVGVPKKEIKLTTDDYERFPVVLDSKPFHHPCHSAPGKKSLPEVVPGQDTLLNNILPKPCYADPKQFQDLAKEYEANEQKVAAALKFFLTYQPELLRKRLTDQFGDQALNYYSLDDELRQIYEKEYPKLFTPEWNKRTFVDFMMEIFQQIYDNAYNTIVLYKGRKDVDKDNGFWLRLPPTHTELYLKPSFYRNVEIWIKEENATLAKDDQYNLDELLKRYHQVWRDAYAPTLKELLLDCYKLTIRLMVTVSSTEAVAKILNQNISTTNGQTLDSDESVSNIVGGKQVNDASLTDTWQLFGHMTVLSEEQIKGLPQVDPQSKYRDVVVFLWDFTNKFHNLTKAYYSQNRKNLIEKDNSDFCSQISLLHDEYDLKIRDILLQTSTDARDFNSIANKLQLCVNQMKFKHHLTKTDQQMDGVAVIDHVKEVLPTTPSQLRTNFNNTLFTWVKGLTTTEFDDYVNEALVLYAPKIYYLSNRIREKPVKDFLTSSGADSNDNRLAYILTSGKEEGALNNILVQHLVPKVLQRYPLLSINKAIQEGRFRLNEELPDLVKSTVAYAKDVKRFILLNTKEGLELFYKTMYDSVDALPKAEFKGVILSAVADYEKHKWGVSRRGTIEGYFATFTRNAKILGMIFVEKGKESTCNVYIFEKLVAHIKEKLKSQPTKQSMLGYKFIMQYNTSENQDFYLKGLEDQAKERSHIQEDNKIITESSNYLTSFS